MSQPFLPAFLLIVSVGFCSHPAPAQAPPQATVAPISTKAATVAVTLTGTIKNFGAFQACVVPKVTYLQLVPLAADGRLTLSHQFKDGRLHYITFASELAELPVPKTAAFRFDIPTLPPGKYFLVAQRTNLKWTTDWQAKTGEGPVFLTGEDVMFIFEVPADAKSPHKVSAGDLVLRLH
jgi:hypothetical protein